MSVMNMCPGLWVIMKAGFEARATACGVTPQAQNMGISPRLISTASPQSGLVTSLMPMAAGSPTWMGAPCAPGKRAEAVTALATISCGMGRIETTMGPWKRPAVDAGLPHRDIAPALDVTERDARVHERPLEGEGAAQQEGDEVIAPEGLDVRHLVGEDTVLVDPVARQVGPQVGARRRADRLGRAHIGHLDQRTRARVALAEEEEVVGVVPGQHGHVGLNEAGAEAGRDAGKLAASDIRADLSRVTGINRHHDLRSTCALGSVLGQVASQIHSALASGCALSSNGHARG